MQKATSRKAALLIILMLAAGSAWAEWVKVTETNALHGYIDPTTIRKNGNYRKVWEIQNQKVRDENGIKSRRFRAEYNCGNERMRLLSASLHSGNMAEGMIIYSFETPSEWMNVPPSTPGETVMKTVCGK